MSRRNPTRTELTNLRRECATLRSRWHSAQSDVRHLAWQLEECRRALRFAQTRSDARKPTTEVSDPPAPKRPLAIAVIEAVGATDYAGAWRELGREVKS